MGRRWLDRWVALIGMPMFGCGGLIANTGADASAEDALPENTPVESDASADCGPIWVNTEPTSSLDAGCAVSASWSCGATTYFVDCSCPDKKSPVCKCSASIGQQVWGSEGPSPSCMCSSAPADLAMQCSFPH